MVEKRGGKKKSGGADEGTHDQCDEGPALKRLKENAATAAANDSEEEPREGQKRGRRDAAKDKGKEKQKDAGVRRSPQVNGGGSKEKEKEREKEKEKENAKKKEELKKKNHLKRWGFGDSGSEFSVSDEDAPATRGDMKKVFYMNKKVFKELKEIREQKNALPQRGEKGEKGISQENDTPEDEESIELRIQKYLDGLPSHEVKKFLVLWHRMTLGELTRDPAGAHLFFMDVFFPEAATAQPCRGYSEWSEPFYVDPTNAVVFHLYRLHAIAEGKVVTGYKVANIDATRMGVMKRVVFDFLRVPSEHQGQAKDSGGQIIWEGGKKGSEGKAKFQDLKTHPSLENASTVLLQPVDELTRLTALSALPPVLRNSSFANAFKGKVKAEEIFERMQEMINPILAEGEKGEPILRKGAKLEAFQHVTISEVAHTLAGMELILKRERFTATVLKGRAADYTSLVEFVFGGRAELDKAKVFEMDDDEREELVSQLRSEKKIHSSLVSPFAEPIFYTRSCLARFRVFVEVKKEGGAATAASGEEEKPKDLFGLDSDED
uniref:Uncharacterized protein n=1 Tax=Chromera velia CCMP2878 TaxID=1169474 RepID=A0A0G4HHL9_9ALVE|eukprot:Cvel_27537.t1-p1 / transcript=Cvel_27537.t1 / gene=Cvel_27537 / organism=Chromera_velia_CCMP2878 / gene_product=hypothetical protein / transcript_product=hypothetical protein / location=Cvel_scaffold3454:13139-15573(-) / protein_length=548 / sequence_SO=supercontig / SO=protein_coding / is_pseudo=false